MTHLPIHCTPSNLQRLQAMSALLALLLSPFAFGLDNDKSALIKIQSDTAEFNEAKGTAIYRGKVELEQGSLLIQSDALTIFNSEEGVSKVLAEGKPAHYQQQMENEKLPVKAKAETITYLPQEDSITLAGEAKLSQGANQFEGEHIHYDLKRNVLKATGGSSDATSDSEAAPSGRVKMVIPPTRKPTSKE